ncbi:hypothetical protein Naga_100534g2 [Nannochloropsis gaditana]|uniref:Uncharacterized protein n=1 Tax=Nannochloropsis gaditana TaxID=72520 RepID=W7TJT9_9STRA|nr:hypothetical protein Naga_100534g2 [Nannochloropsis gaditana]
MERAEHNRMKAVNMTLEVYSIPGRGCEDVFIFWPHLLLIEPSSKENNALSLFLKSTIKSYEAYSTGYLILSVHFFYTGGLLTWSPIVTAIILTMKGANWNNQGSRAARLSATASSVSQHYAMCGNDGKEDKGTEQGRERIGREESIRLKLAAHTLIVFFLHHYADFRGENTSPKSKQA